MFSTTNYYTNSKLHNYSAYRIISLPCNPSANVLRPGMCLQPRGCHWYDWIGSTNIGTIVILLFTSFFFRIIGIVDTVAIKLVLEEQTETLLSPAVALSVTPAEGSNFQETSFSISDPNNVQVCHMNNPVYYIYITYWSYITTSAMLCLPVGF